MIKLQVIGHLGLDAQQNEVNGKKVINFSVAHTEKYKDAQGNSQEKTIWVSCAYWTDKVGILPYLKKGSLIYVEGQPDIRMFTTKDGRQEAQMILRCSQIDLLNVKKEDQFNAVNQQTMPHYASSNETP